jgi:hypothetical protein
MELKLELAQRISRNERASARKRRIDGLSINAHRNCVTGYCPYCTGNRTFSRNVPARVAIAEELDAVTPAIPEPEPWTYYDTAATFYGEWDYARARNDDALEVVNTWQAFEADHDGYFWSCLSEDAGIRWEPVNGVAWTHNQTLYDSEWDD